VQVAFQQVTTEARAELNRLTEAAHLRPAARGYTPAHPGAHLRLGAVRQNQAKSLGPAQRF
jgi:hypothetical protein